MKGSRPAVTAFMGQGGGIQTQKTHLMVGVIVEDILKKRISGSAFKELRDVAGSERLEIKVNEDSQRLENKSEMDGEPEMCEDMKFGIVVGAGECMQKEAILL